MVRHSIVSKWPLEVPLNHLVVENEEHPISDVSGVHIRPDQVKWGGGGTDIPDINRRRDTDIDICEDLKNFLRRKLSLKVA